jgi:hypothetical protein
MSAVYSKINDLHDQTMSFKEWETYCDQHNTGMQLTDFTQQSASYLYSDDCYSTSSKGQSSIDEHNHSKLTAPDTKSIGITQNDDLFALCSLYSSVKLYSQTSELNSNNELTSVRGVQASSYDLNEASSHHTYDQLSAKKTQKSDISEIFDETIKDSDSTTDTKKPKRKWTKENDKVLYRIICTYCEENNLDSEDFMANAKQHSYSGLNIIKTRSGWGLAIPRLVNRIQKFLVGDKSKNCFTVRERKAIRKRFYQDLSFLNTKISELKFETYDWQTLKENFPTKSILSIQELCKTFGKHKNKVSSNSSTTTLSNDNVSDFYDQSE